MMYASAGDPARAPDDGGAATGLHPGGGGACHDPAGGVLSVPAAGRWDATWSASYAWFSTTSDAVSALDDSAGIGIGSGG